MARRLVGRRDLEGHVRLHPVLVRTTHEDGEAAFPVDDEEQPELHARERGARAGRQAPVFHRGGPARVLDRHRQDVGERALVAIPAGDADELVGPTVPFQVGRQGDLNVRLVVRGEPVADDRKLGAVDPQEVVDDLAEARSAVAGFARELVHPAHELLVFGRELADFVVHGRVEG